MNYYIISYIENPIGESGEQCKTEYDFTAACNECGTGAEVIGSLRVKSLSNIKKDFFETIDGDFIVSNSFYQKIKSHLENLELFQVRDSKNQLMDFFHFSSKIVLPKSGDNSTGLIVEDQCPICKRNGYFSDAKIGNIVTKTPTTLKPLILKYKKRELEEFENSIIMKTWECYGLSNKIPKGKYVTRYARPLIIVNETMKTIFESEGIKNVSFDKLLIE